jgi:hypothetical protein
MLLALGGCALPLLPDDNANVPLPAGLDTAADLRGVYRATLCARPAMAGSACGQTLYRFAGERGAPAAAPADPTQYRLLFVPGFLATCYAGIHSFADVADAARRAGFAADILSVGGRDGIAVNARRLAAQIDQLPSDGRRIIVIAHSKGAADTLEMFVQRPDLVPRVVAVIGVAGAFRGSPLAESLAFAYRGMYGVLPPSGCATSDGDPIGDLTYDRRRAWWAAHGATLGVPLYALATVPQPEGVSALLLLPRALLAMHSHYNDGMLLAADEVPPGGRLLGIVNADHLTAGIPYPQLPWALWFSAAPFARTDVVLAAVDVVAAEQGETPPVARSADDNSNAELRIQPRRPRSQLHQVHK